MHVCCTTPLLLVWLEATSKGGAGAVIRGHSQAVGVPAQGTTEKPVIRKAKLWQCDSLGQTCTCGHDPDCTRAA